MDMTTELADPSATTDSSMEDLPLGELIDARAELNTRIKAQAEVLNELKAEETRLDALIMTKLDAVGLNAGSGRHATMSIKESVVPNLKSWADLCAYMAATGNFQLVNKAVNAAAFRELNERGLVPGVEPYTRRVLHFKSL